MNVEDKHGGVVETGIGKDCNEFRPRKSPDSPTSTLTGFIYRLA